MSKVNLILTISIIIFNLDFNKCEIFQNDFLNEQKYNELLIDKILIDYFFKHFFTNKICNTKQTKNIQLKSSINKIDDELVDELDDELSSST